MLCFSLKGLLFLERTREEKERGRVIKRKRDVEKRESEEEKKRITFLFGGNGFVAQMVPKDREAASTGAAAAGNC